MVLGEHRQHYEELEQALERLRQLGSTEALTAAVAEITQQFQQQILTLNLTEMDEAIALRLQSIQTEISKQLRLLAMDTMFLKTARQPETSQHRRQQIGDRLDLLRRYCEAILATEILATETLATETLATETLATETLATDLAVDGADLDQCGAELA